MSLVYGVFVKCMLALFAIPSIYYFNTTETCQRLLAYLSGLPYADGSTFDYVVVGSGSAGSVVAARLAETGKAVLLVEAGGPSHWMQGIPAFTIFFQSTNYDWQFETVPQEKAVLAMNGRKSKWPRGKELGGTSMMNYFLYMRGHRKDYDEWADMGNTGWSYDDVLPYFKRSEGYQQNDRNENDDKHKEQYHGFHGPLGVMKAPISSQFGEVIINATAELGEQIGDLNGDAQDGGFARHDEMLRDGWRIGNFRSFCEKLYSLARLNVLTYAHVTKVIMKEKVAVGIELERFGRTLKYLARNEVVLSAGAIGSPQILMLSGIGPKDHLEKLGIAVEADLPVGDNLQDHILIPTMIETNQAITMSPLTSVNPLNYLQLLLSNSGPLQDNGVVALGLIHTSLSDGIRPDSQFYIATFSYAMDFGLIMKKFINYEEEGYQQVHGPVMGKYVGLLLPSLNRPKSFGTIRLKSKDPLEKPIIDPRYLTDQHDVDVLVEGMKYTMKILTTKSAKKYNLKIIPDLFHCGKFETFSKEYFECHIREA